MMNGNDMNELNLTAIRTIQNIFPKEDVDSIVNSAYYCDLNEAWCFMYRAPFSDNERKVLYQINKWDGSISIAW